MVESTKEQILSSAEKLFSKQGIKATSLRAITADAGVNLAAVNYHFGSKSALVEAVFSRRLVPMNDERVRQLQALQLEYAGSPIPLSRLVRAFVAPAFSLSRDVQKGGATFVRLLGRSYSEHDDALHESLRRMYAPVIERFRPAFEQALPELPAEELYWRLHFMVGLLAYLMSGSDMMRLIASSNITEPEDNELLMSRLVHFVCAGMNAASPDNHPDFPRRV
jgi:AcrR family transcriptional regulator